MGTSGKWLVSNNEESWTCDEEFDTKEQAVEYAKFHYAEEYGLSDGDHNAANTLVEDMIAEIRSEDA